MRLAHLHVPRLIPYTHSLRLQNELLERHFRYKDAIRSSGAGNGIASSTSADEQPSSGRVDTGPKRDISEEAAEEDVNGRIAPDPVLLTFSTLPTYTVGRRHLLTNPISPAQQSFLTASGLATFHASPRGGLLTYHAPGQLTGYVIADLRRHGITPRCWVKMLEEAVMRTCAGWGVATVRTDDPGVWVAEAVANQKEQDIGSWSCSSAPAPSSPSLATGRKICAVGVQVSRGITSHGVGLNVYDAGLGLGPPWTSSPSRNYTFTPGQMRSPSYDASTRGHLSWGFSRIVACGLEGKSVTWLTREIPRSHTQGESTAEGESKASDHCERTSIAMDDVADVFAREVLRGLNSMKGRGKDGVEAVYRVHETDVLPL